MKPDRGNAIGGCDHTNDKFYERNGCHACDDDLDKWVKQQEQDNQREQGQTAREETGGEAVVDRDC